jgi:APA family basic amino acid/polyamine antiporter
MEQQFSNRQSVFQLDDKSKVTQTHELKKVLGVAFGIALMVGSVIGAGILRTPGTVAQYLQSYWLIIGCWVFGGVYVLMAVSAYAELGTMLPKAGGGYNYVKRAYGNYAGFISGWFQFLVIGISPAYYCILIGEYLPMLFPSLVGYEKSIAVAFLTAFTFYHLTGVKNGSVMQQITCIIKVACFATLIIACFIFSGIKINSGQTTSSLDTIINGGIFLAIFKSLELITGTYGGWDNLSIFAEEDKNPGKNIPRSYFTGAIIVMLIYVLINMAFLHVLSISTVASSKLAAADAANAVFGNKGAIIVTVIALFSIIGAFNGHIMAIPRTLFGLSRDGFFITNGTYVNKKGTPVTALIFSSVLNLILIVIGSFDILYALGGFMALIVPGLVFASLIKLRIKEPDLPRPYHAWGYPYTTMVMILITIALFIGFALGDISNFIVIAAVSLLSYPVYILFIKRKAKVF